MKRLVLLAIAAVSVMASDARRDAYIISKGDNVTYRAAFSVEQLQAVRKRITGRYMWVQRGGVEYVIRDEATIRRVEALFAPVDALAPEHEAVSREESTLDRETDRLSDKDHLSSGEKTRLRELRDRLRAVSRQERELDRKQDELEDEAERALWVEVDAAIDAGIAKPTAALRR